MSTLPELLSHPRAVMIGWSLIHFLWQGALVAVALGVLLRAMKRSTAEARYALGCAAMGVLLLCPPMTYALMDLEVIRRITAYGGNAVPAFLQSIVATVAPAIHSDEAARLAASLAGAWAAAVLVLLIRLLAGWLKVQRVSRSAMPVANMVFQGRLSVMALRVGIRYPVRLMESALASGPAVVGFWRPMVLFPTAALTGLWPVQVEAILAHELAHIRRHDYLVNLVQSLVETLLFYHPAVWWVSARIREERENCCDDLAVKACAATTLPSSGDRRFYAGCLADLDDLRPMPMELAMNAATGSLLWRVRRILSMPQGGGGAGTFSLGMLAMAGLFMVALAQSQQSQRTSLATSYEMTHVGNGAAFQEVYSMPSSILQSPESQDEASDVAADPAPASLTLYFPNLNTVSIWNAGRWIERHWPREALASNRVERAKTRTSAPPVQISDMESDFPQVAPAAGWSQPPSPAPPAVGPIAQTPRPRVGEPPQMTAQIVGDRYLVVRMPLMSVTHGPILSASDGPVMSVQGGPIMSVQGGPLMSVQGGPIMSVTGGPRTSMPAGPLTSHSMLYQRLTAAFPSMTIKTNGQR